MRILVTEFVQKFALVLYCVYVVLYIYSCTIVICTTSILKKIRSPILHCIVLFQLLLCPYITQHLEIRGTWQVPVTFPELCSWWYVYEKTWHFFVRTYLCPTRNTGSTQTCTRRLHNRFHSPVAGTEQRSWWMLALALLWFRTYFVCSPAPPEHDGLVVTMQEHR